MTRIFGLILFLCLLTSCGPTEDPNLRRDQRGEAIKLVQNSPGPDQKNKVVDFVNQTLNLLKATGTPVRSYGWSASADKGSKEYTVKFIYLERNSTREAVWSANIETGEVKAKNAQAHKFSW